MAEPPPTPVHSSATLYDYLKVLWRRKTFLILFVGIGVGLTIVYSFLVPYEYTASAKLMPPEKEGGTSSSFASLLQSGGVDFSDLTGSKSGKVFAEILTSRTLADSLIHRLDLMNRYDLPESRQLAVQAVQANLYVDVAKSGTITVAFTTETERIPSSAECDTARMLAAEIVNEAITLLDELNREKSVTEARSSREFLGEMTDLKRAELDSARQRMAEFQTENKAFDVDKQLSVTVETLAETQAQIQKVQLKIAQLRQDLSPDNAMITALQNQLNELRKQKAQLSDTDVLGMDLSEAPDLAMEYAKLRLDLEVAAKVYTYLESQYHSEQVAEARDLPTVSVLDSAIAPDIRSAPRRTFMVVVATGIFVFLGVVSVFLLELFGAEFRRFASEVLPSSLARRLGTDVEGA